MFFSVCPLMRRLGDFWMTGGRFRVQRGRRQLDMQLSVRCYGRHGEGQEGVS